MMYQAAKSELQSPPGTVSFTALAVETATMLAVSLAIVLFV